MTDSTLLHNDAVRVLSIGGTGVFGMNCLLIQSPQTRLLIDCGVLFPADTDFGVDLITPDFSIFNQNFPDALLITHGHEDHIGAIPYFLQEIFADGYKGKFPIYGSDFSLALVRRKLDEHDLSKRVDFNVMRAKLSYRFKDMTVEPIDVCHSIPGSFAFALDTIVGKIVHSGDWRIDNTPMVGAKTNLARFEELGDDGVRLFLSDSTNVEVDNDAITSELDVFNNIQSCIKQATGRVFITLFASNIGRLQSIIYAASNCGRKLVLCGRSVHANAAAARELGYLKVPANIELLRDDEMDPNDDNLVIVVSGSQGEKTASLYKISQGDHPKLKLRPSDTLIYSARQIPGNERRVDDIINGFYKQGASLVNRPDLNFHSSGHGSQRELELLLDLIAPQLFVPVHGDYRRLTLHEQLAQRLGDRMLTERIAEGQCVVLFADHHELRDGYVPSRRYVVGKCPDGINRAIMKDKRNLAYQGIIIVTGLLDENDELVGDLRVQDIGVCANNGWRDELPVELRRTIATSAHHGDMEEIIRHKTAKLVKNSIGCFPTIVVNFMRMSEAS